MDFKVFKEVVKKVQIKTPFLFELGHDNIPTAEDIIAFQKQHKILFPEKYIQFLSNFGGGYFGYTNIYSLPSLLFIADNGCGDYYAFRIQNSRCSEEIVFYDHENGTVQNTDFSDVLEYLVKIGLNR